jgi:magnesium chelatase subunit I
MIALAARAYAALQGAKQVNNDHVAMVARLAIQHRRPEVLQSNQIPWSDEDDNHVTEILSSE